MMITMLMDDGNPDLYLKDKAGKSVLDYAEGLNSNLRDLFYSKRDKVEKKRRADIERFKLEPLELEDPKNGKSAKKPKSKIKGLREQLEEELELNQQTFEKY